MFSHKHSHIRVCAQTYLKKKKQKEISRKIFNVNQIEIHSPMPMTRQQNQFCAETCIIFIYVHIENSTEYICRPVGRVDNQIDLIFAY